MSKRVAGVQLTDRNWDNEDEHEEAGHFRVAGDDQLSKRIIKKAKRRVQGSEEPANSFKGFQGFGVPQNSSTPGTSSFSGFKGFGNQNVSENKEPVESKKDSDSVYMSQLKRLNQEVCEWIMKHINENPYVDLTPVFKDYEKHIMSLEKKFPAAMESEVTVTKVAGFPASSGSPVSTVQDLRGPVSSISTTTANGSTTSSQGSVGKTVCDTEDDTPKTQSQVMSTPEEDSFYSIRCKLFFKREEDWAELGVGMLSLKKIEEKVQVLIRNDTALGKILLNIFINDSTPTSRSGKNNVLLMTVPNPPVFGKEGDNTKPVSYLIRVKTAENADELHKHLQTA